MPGVDFVEDRDDVLVGRFERERQENATELSPTRQRLQRPFGLAGIRREEDLRVRAVLARRPRIASWRAPAPPGAVGARTPAVRCRGRISRSRRAASAERRTRGLEHVDLLVQYRGPRRRVDAVPSLTSAQFVQRRQRQLQASHRTLRAIAGGPWRGPRALRAPARRRLRISERREFVHRLARLFERVAQAASRAPS